MKRMIQYALLGAILTASIAPAMAKTENVSCDLVPKSQWATCIVEQSQERGSD